MFVANPIVGQARGAALASSRPESAQAWPPMDFSWDARDLQRAQKATALQSRLARAGYRAKRSAPSGDVDVGQPALKNLIWAAEM